MEKDVETMKDERKLKGKFVKCSFYKKPMISVPGSDSCSPHFDIAKSAREWQVIHVPSGLCGGNYKSLKAARFAVGILVGFGFDWNHPDRFATWQRRHPELMPLFRATGHVMVQIS